MNPAILYTILRIQRVSNPTNQDEINVKFFPINGNPGIVLAVTADEALKTAKRRFPSLAHSICVQPQDLYAASISRMLANRVQRNAKAGSVGAKGENSKWGETEPGRLEPVC